MEVFDLNRDIRRGDTQPLTQGRQLDAWGTLGSLCSGENRRPGQPGGDCSDPWKHGSLHSRDMEGIVTQSPGTPPLELLGRTAAVYLINTGTKYRRRAYDLPSHGPAMHRTDAPEQQVLPVGAESSGKENLTGLSECAYFVRKTVPRLLLETDEVDSKVSSSTSWARLTGGSRVMLGTQ